jgi:hypothetical protein
MEEEIREPTEQEVDEKIDELRKRLEKKKRGGQPGNQNARTHGFYSRVLTKAERRNYNEADNIDGLDAEIKLLRTKIKTLLDTQPDNLKLISQALFTLAKLIGTKHGVGGEQTETRTEATLNILRDIALPAGVSIEKMVK